MPVTPISFAEALRLSEDGKRHLLLGNGFSIALFHDRFSYGSLLRSADENGLFDDMPEARKVFDLFNTQDFELVIDALRKAIMLLPLYEDQPDTLALMQSHADALKEILVRAIAGRHPERPSDITDEQYAACRAFLAHFIGENRTVDLGEKVKDYRGNIYSLNYDLLLYWTLLHDDPLVWDEEEDEAEKLTCDDGFRAPDDDPEASYVAWEAEGAADGQNIHFLHGALYLFDDGPELKKYCWERSGGIPLIEQIRSALAQNLFPLFVSEGDSKDKLARIRHSGYLQRSLKSFARICQTRGTSLFIFGHSFAENDIHILKHIGKGSIRKLFVSLYGDPNSATNQEIVATAESLVAQRHEKKPLELLFYSAESANVWGDNVPS